MFELPLFPLNTVLFPGMPITLHIFEDRYKKMMQLCLAQNRPFGVVLIREGIEAYGPLAMPHSVGCTARIAQMEPLTEGRMNILAIGQERFEIVTLNRSRAYLMGQVKLAPIDDPDPDALPAATERLRRRLARYLDILNEAGLVDFDPANLPTDAIDLAYLGASLLQISSEQKQALLTAGRAHALLTAVGEFYRREVALLEMMVARAGAGDDQAPFSLN
ncbi:MAG: LON peptidase substrate-binding domain-containing protein [Anaerolineae bacterium]|nr:LON peptidase substrate-binding domain-containing protein [Anaerolineae bacterium]